jgi:D-alanyl-D-alanine carboxypeptidase
MFIHFNKISILLPYTLITIGIVLVFFIPLKFYSSNNLNVPFSFGGQIVRAEESVNNSLTAIRTGGDSAVFPASKPILPLPKDKSIYDSKLTAVSAVVMDARTKKILFEKNITEARPLASITKLMSAIILLGLPVDWQSTTTIISADGNSDQLVSEGEIYKLDDLWNVALIGSSNKAIKALVRSSGLSEAQFIVEMNKKAEEFGLSSLHFDGVTGLSEKNIGNVQDISNMLIEALHFEKIYTALHIGEYYARPLNKEKLRRVWSTNWLLTNWEPNDFKACNIAGKTGYIPESLYNFTVSLSNENKHQIIVTVLGASCNESRFSEARDLANWTFAHYLWPEDEGYSELAE